MQLALSLCVGWDLWQTRQDTHALPEGSPHSAARKYGPTVACFCMFSTEATSVDFYVTSLHLKKLIFSLGTSQALCTTPLPCDGHFLTLGSTGYWLAGSVLVVSLGKSPSEDREEQENEGLPKGKHWEEWRKLLGGTSRGGGHSSEAGGKGSHLGRGSISRSKQEVVSGLLRGWNGVLRSNFMVELPKVLGKKTLPKDDQSFPFPWDWTICLVTGHSMIKLGQFRDNGHLVSLVEIRWTFRRLPQ